MVWHRSVTTVWLEPVWVSAARLIAMVKRAALHGGQVRHRMRFQPAICRNSFDRLTYED